MRKKTVSLKRLSSCTTAEHLHRQASLMFPFYVALSKTQIRKKASFMLHFKKVVIINVA